MRGSVILDPERIGFVLQRITRTSDYQDLRLWRLLTLLGIRLSRVMFPTVIVPMTVWREDYRTELARGIARIDPDTMTITLTAAKETLLERIRSRRQRSAVPWSLTYLDRCLDAFAPNRTSLPVATDAKTPENIADEILETIKRRPLQL